MGISDRLERLEATRGKSAPDDRHLRPVFQLEGQTEEEAHQLSEFSAEPIERCAVITEAVLRQIYRESDGDEIEAERVIAEIRAGQQARLIERGNSKITVQ